MPARPVAEQQQTGHEQQVDRQPPDRQAEPRPDQCGQGALCERREEQSGRTAKPQTKPSDSSQTSGSASSWASSARRTGKRVSVVADMAGNHLTRSPSQPPTDAPYRPQPAGFGMLDSPTKTPRQPQPMAKRQLNRRQSWRIEKIQKSAPPVPRVARAVPSRSWRAATGPEQTGLVIAHFGVQVEVEALEGEHSGQVFRCHLRANLPALVTGDRVVWRPGNRGIGVIVAQLPRHSELCRPDMRGQLKPVAANVDLIVIVFAPPPSRTPT